MGSWPASQRRRQVVVLTLAMTLAAVIANPAIAGAQEQISDDEAELSEREGALIDLITKGEDSIEQLRTERSRVLVETDNTTAAIEGTADTLEQLALARRGPALVRSTMAVERFVSGEPSQQALTQELNAMDHDSSLFQQQQVYGSIIESANRELARLDEEIQLLQSQVPTLLTARTELMNRRVSIDAQVEELEAQITDAQNDLAGVSEALQWYRDSAGRSVLTGRPTQHGNGRAALAVKIDNVPSARPQSGINNADIVYVELVEGGSTRYAAVFHSEEAESVGPIRSMRTTDINLLRGLNSPLFANSGGNPRTTTAINNSPLVNIGHATGAGPAYFRASDRRAPHNLYSSTKALRGVGGTAGGTPPSQFIIRRPGSENPNQISQTNGVSVNYRNTTVSYAWNGAGWARSQDGQATVDTDGVRTAPESVIVRFTPYGVSPADARSPEATTVGEGQAWILTEGILIEGSWSKPSADAVTVYRDEDGRPIQLLPGRVWVELPKPGDATLR